MTLPIDIYDWATEEDNFFLTEQDIAEIRAAREARERAAQEAQPTPSPVKTT